MLQRINYYRLSGYWYPFRQKTTDGRGDHFYPGVVPRSVV
ncbi:Abi family protein [Microbacterium sp. MMO-56]